ncbi:hypothetical protein ACSBOX_11590 [Arthrobacter sp. KN11-1C]|uniref:hypothetical protein n=1 Tax=Arthrobacter sp. KN11-1C TaxID=3445774 RepID=UPI003FA18139
MTGQRRCAFCGSAGPLTREHVLGNWLSKIGLESAPVENVAGPLNRIGKSLGVAPPFQMTVKNVCKTCNNGWMEGLEQVAHRVLTPLILGEPGGIHQGDQGAVAAWLQKTALVAMLVSSADDREQGYGLPPSEYELLYQLRNDKTPLPASMFWIGRYSGELRLGSVWVTPLSLNVDRLPESDMPHAYAMTVALGALLIHGIRFTNLPFYIDVATGHLFEHLWPTQEAMTGTNWEDLEELGDTEFLALARGRSFVVPEPELTLRPWRPAAELKESTLVGSMVKLPTLCGKHVTYYPASLVEEALCGRFYWFKASCDCDQIAYLVRTESDGAHAKSADTPERVAAQYDALPGPELVIENPNGRFVVKPASKVS